MTNRGQDADGTRQERDFDQPAPAVSTKAETQWKLNWPGGEGFGQNALTTRPVDEPAPTIALGHNVAAWAWERPSTAVMGDPRVAPPGYRGGADDRATTMMANAVRVELHELATLQAFPADFAWIGNRSAQAKAIGNAVPPRAAAHIVAALTGADLPDFGAILGIA